MLNLYARQIAFLYGAIFAIAGSIGLLLIPGKRNRSAFDA